MCLLARLKVFCQKGQIQVPDNQHSERRDLIPYVDMIKKLKAQNVIDFGCGTGSLALLLEQESIDVVGVDPAAAMIDVASQSLVRIKSSGLLVELTS